MNTFIPEGERSARLPSAFTNSRPKVREATGKALKELWADPVWREQLLAKRKVAAAKGKKQTSRRAPQGVRKWQAKRFQRQARFEATLTMKKLETSGVLDDADEQAKSALHKALEVMRDQMTSAKDALAAARLVLDFTKAKPAQKSEVTISSAEAWLAEVVADAASN